MVIDRHGGYDGLGLLGWVAPMLGSRSNIPLAFALFVAGASLACSGSAVDATAATQSVDAATSDVDHDGSATDSDGGHVDVGAAEDGSGSTEVEFDADDADPETAADVGPDGEGDGDATDATADVDEDADAADGAADVEEDADAADGAADVDEDADAGDAEGDAADGTSDHGPDLPPGCASHLDCPAGEACNAGECRATPCLGAFDCRASERCTPAGCIDATLAECSAHDDCGRRDRCDVDGRCRGRRATTGHVALEPVPTGLDAHVFGVSPSDVIAFGHGGALVDIDGDLDLDVFLGGNPDVGATPCLYRNLSAPGELVFEPIDAFCGREWPHLVAGAGVGDGSAQDLVLLGNSAVFVVSVDDAVTVVDLMSTLSDDDPRDRCTAGTAVAMDLDRDGRSDIYVGCQHSLRLASTLANIPFMAGGDEVYSALEFGHEPELENPGPTLGIAPTDLNDDGLLDIVLANDTFSGPDLRNIATDPGGVLFACPPGAGCTWHRRLLASGNEAWGSYMGVGRPRVDGGPEAIYLTDWGPNRLVHFDAGEPVDTASDRGIALGRGTDWLFAWGVVVADFDRNGLDDLLIAQGDVHPDRLAAGEDVGHRDTLFLQSDGGRFEARTREEFASGLATDIGSPTRSMRGAVRADLDFDGRLEILTIPYVGAPRLEHEVAGPWPATPRCTLVPRPRYVPAYGFGYRVQGSEPGDPWVEHDIQGQNRLGASPWVVTGEPRGSFRFPSGAVVPFDCRGTPGPVIVAEPEWLDVGFGEGVVSVSVGSGAGHDAVASVAIATAGPSGESAPVPAVLVDGRWTVSATGADRAMVRIDGRWVGRWFVR